MLDERQAEEERLIAAQFKAFHDTLAQLVCLLDIVDRDRLVPEVGSTCCTNRSPIYINGSEVVAIVVCYVSCPRGLR